MESEKNSVKAEYRTVPDKASISKAAEFMENTLEVMGISFKIANKAQIILDEIYSNIVYYSKAQNALITVIGYPDSLELIFEDDGIAYDPTSTKEPDTTLLASEREPGGLGIFMVKKMAQEVSYQYSDNKNILKVVLLLNQ